MTLFMLKRVPSILVLKRRKKMSLPWLELTVSPFTQEIMKINFCCDFLFSDQNIFFRDWKHYINWPFMQRGEYPIYNGTPKIYACSSNTEIHLHTYFCARRTQKGFKGTVVNRTFPSLTLELETTCISPFKKIKIKKR